jgi:hypothetical protein
MTEEDWEFLAFIICMLGFSILFFIGLGLFSQ